MVSLRNAVIRPRSRTERSTLRAGEPAKKIVIVPSGYGYERPDGVTVLPLTALGS